MLLILQAIVYFTSLNGMGFKFNFV